MPTAEPVIVLEHVSFAWPDGSVVFDGLSAAFTARRTGIIGPNGAGKSTLLRLIAGELVPQAGMISTRGQVAYLAQSTVDSARTVADLLGVAAIRRALRAIADGSADQRDYDTIGQRWDAEAVALAALAGLGLPVTADIFDRPATALSGGEAMAVALAGIRLAGPDITLLDEPTNNLDAPARRALADAIDHWPGVLLVVSHDRALLEHVDGICDLDRHGPRFFGGTFSQYDAYRQVQQAAAEADLQAADQALATAKRAWQKSLQAQAQRDRAGRRAAVSGKYPPIVAHSLKRAAQATAGRQADVHARRIAEARDARLAADETARRDEPIHLALPGTTVPAGRNIATVTAGDMVLTIRGPERIRLAGDNGVGKSTLLALLLGQPAPQAETVLPGFGTELFPGLPAGFLAQRDELSGDNALAAVQAAAPRRTAQEARALLAALRLTKDKPLQPLAGLSGGERFRVRLARLLFTEPPPQLLILDEPTNNLDMASVDQLIESLADFRGALLIVTHDDYLAASLTVHRTWTLRRAGPGAMIDDALT